MDANQPEKFLFESWSLNEQLEQPVRQRGKQIQPWNPFHEETQGGTAFKGVKK